MEFHDLPEIASITSMVTLDNVLPGSEDQHNGDYLSTIVKKCTTFCKSNDVSDPIHVLKIFQKEIVTGRPLELTEETSSTGIYGETNFILVDRGDLLKTAIEEIRAISDMRKCLEVQFYGECAADFGGPRKEFFSLVLHCIKEEYFEPVREWSDDYEAVGRILALSTIQNGRLPRIMSAELVEKVFNQVLPVDKYIQDLRKGLDSLGLVQLVQELPAVIHLFTPQQSNPLTVKMLTHLLNPQFSAEGSNRRQRENSTYTLFIKYMREAAKDAFQNPTGFSSAVCVLLLERRRSNDTTHNITNHHQHQHQHGCTPPPAPSKRCDRAISTNISGFYHHTTGIASDTGVRLRRFAFINQRNVARVEYYSALAGC
ncbi:uncharacterized protein LOC127870915 isoform X5 [Dreissena polymorpha]|nr:uncharacterized protein LOC127870915 isoform X5 [Dreissena polymorpha]